MTAIIEADVVDWLRGREWLFQAGYLPREETLTVLRGDLWYNCSIANANERRMLSAPAPVLTIGKGDFQMATSDYITFECPVCGKTFGKYASTIRSKHGHVFCSRECHYKGRSLGLSKRIVTKPYNLPAPRLINCVTCGQEFHPKNSKQTHCCRKCFEKDHRKNMRGDKNPSFIDGRSYNKRGNRGSEWKEIRLAVYERDHFTCQCCGKKCIARDRADATTTLDVIQCHHIEPYRLHHNNNMDNLITLCLKCHLETENANHARD